MALTDGEAQLLANLHAAEKAGDPTDRESLEERGVPYWIFLEDWSKAFESLNERRLISGVDGRFHLTEAGRPLGESLFLERGDPIRFYYQRFYPAAYASKTHSTFCKCVYGKDLCQEGQMDMGSLHDLLSYLQLEPGNRLLDVGCGAGVISSYIAERTGCYVTGVDYAAPAIEEANRRAARSGSYSHLEFLCQDIDTLELPATSFDAAISLDSLYWVEDLYESLARIVSTVKPGGQLGIFYMRSLEEGEPETVLEADNTELASTLLELNLDYQSYDYTSQVRSFWLRAREVAMDLRGEFESEGNGFICANWLREADELVPVIEAGKITRYFYHVQL